MDDLSKPPLPAPARAPGRTRRRRHPAAGAHARIQVSDVGGAPPRAAVWLLLLLLLLLLLIGGDREIAKFKLFIRLGPIRSESRGRSRSASLIPTQIRVVAAARGGDSRQAPPLATNEQQRLDSFWQQ